MIRLKKYRDVWLAEKVDEFIGFYTREFFCLDNFSAFGFVYNGRYYQTAEHAYQSLKFSKTSPETEEKIIRCFSAYDAQKLAHENIKLQAEDWDERKASVMEQLLRAKLEQNPYIKKKLLQTEDYLLCEDSPEDWFWGIGSDRTGRNELGKLWMKLREEIRRNE